MLNCPEALFFSIKNPSQLNYLTIKIERNQTSTLNLIYLACFKAYGKYFS